MTTSTIGNTTTAAASQSTTANAVLTINNIVIASSRHPISWPSASAFVASSARRPRHQLDLRSTTWHTARLGNLVSAAVVATLSFVRYRTTCWRGDMGAKRYYGVRAVKVEGKTRFAA